MSTNTSLIAVPALLALILAGFSFSALAQDEAHSQTVVEEKLKVLDRYVGEWDIDMGITSGEDGADESRHKGTVSAQWIVADRFVEQTSTLLGPDGKPAGIVRVIMTYDGEKEMYRSWWFASGGVMLECLGTWEEDTKTMHWISQVSPRGILHTMNASFPEDGVENWVINVLRASGEMSAKGRGTNTRRKKE